MPRSLMRTLTALLLAACSTPLLAQDRADLRYDWKSVAIVGGGFVSGLAFHPKEPGLMVARTDMGGAYRRDRIPGPWQPLLDGLSLIDVNLMGVESLALDPNDPDALFLACGTYSNPASPNGALLRSTFARMTAPSNVSISAAASWLASLPGASSLRTCASRRQSVRDLDHSR